MARKIIYIVHSYYIDDYETYGEQYQAYVHKENAFKRLQDIKEQDFMPIVDDRDYDIERNSETIFEAGYDGEYSRGCVHVSITKTELLD
jgi:hypothetical protein